mgnify:CR=1 FL=1
MLDVDYSDLTDHPMDELRDLGYDLEPVVGHEVRAKNKDGLIGELLDAIEEGEEEGAQVVLKHFPSMGSKMLDPEEADSPKEVRWENTDNATGQQVSEEEDLPVAEDPEPEEEEVSEEDAQDQSNLDEILEALATEDMSEPVAGRRRSGAGFSVGSEAGEVVCLIQCHPSESLCHHGDLIPFPEHSVRLGAMPHSWVTVDAAVAMHERGDGRLNLRVSALDREGWSELLQRVGDSDG